MIATCPQCAARYRVKDDKIPDRGARITCPKCGHRFVVHREGHAVVGESPPQGVPVTFARQGQMTRNSAPMTDDDESDAPTTVMPHGSSLAREIRAALEAKQREAPAANAESTPNSGTGSSPPPSAPALREAARAEAQANQVSGPSLSKTVLVAAGITVIAIVALVLLEYIPA